jgi:hypothetical protein
LLRFLKLRQSTLGGLALLMERSLGLDQSLAFLVEISLQLRNQCRKLFGVCKRKWRKINIRHVMRMNAVAETSPPPPPTGRQGRGLYLVLLFGLVSFESVELGQNVLGQLGAEIVANSHLYFSVELQCCPSCPKGSDNNKSTHVSVNQIERSN